MLQHLAGVGYGLIHYQVDANYACMQQMVPTSEPAESLEGPCIVCEYTTQCKKSVIDMAKLHREQFAGIDSITFDFIDIISALGPSVIAKREDS